MPTMIVYTHSLSFKFIVLSGVTIKDHRKWKTVENQTFSTVFIFAQTAKIGISEHSAV